MSFRIHASGSTRARAPLFHYARNGLEVSDAYDSVEALRAIGSVASASRPALAGLRPALAGAVADSETDRATAASPHQQAVTAMADMTGVGVLATNFLLLFASCTPLDLLVAVRAGNVVWPDSGGNASFLFLASEGAPVQRMFTGLDRVLAAGGMNGFGVLSALAAVFASYGRVAGRGADGRYRLIVTISQ